MRILCIGDVVGGVGALALAATLPVLRQEQNLDMVVVNSENAAGGVGLTPATAKDLLAAGADVLTGGNHLWKYKDLIPYMDREPRLLRPLNYPDPAPGRGYGLFELASGQRVGVLNLQGQIFMEPVGCPFRAGEAAVAELAKETRLILVDMHAEATSEKRALAWHLEGKVSALFGTHTHVPTADEEVLPGGTGYITDLGMTGPYRSVIGTKTGPVLKRFLTMRPTNWTTAKEDVRVCGAIFDIDGETGKCRKVERVRVDVG